MHSAPWPAPKVDISARVRRFCRRFLAGFVRFCPGFEDIRPKVRTYHPSSDPLPDPPRPAAAAMPLYMHPAFELQVGLFGTKLT